MKRFIIDINLYCLGFLVSQLYIFVGDLLCIISFLTKNKESFNFWINKRKSKELTYGRNYFYEESNKDVN